MDLIRFDVDRLPTPDACRGIADWVHGSIRQGGGMADFDDYVPFNSGVILTDPATSEVTAKSSERFGVINVFEAAGSNETAGIQRQLYHDINLQQVTYFGTRVKLISDADSPQLFIGLSDAAVTGIWSSGAIASGSNQDMFGFRWNADESVDIVKVLDGTLSTVVDDIGADIERTDGFIKFEMRIEESTPGQYRVVPFINGAKKPSAITKLASSAISLVPMRLNLAATVSATTDVSFDVDWTFSGDR